MLKSLVALCTVGYASDLNKMGKKMVTVPIDRGLTPFSKKINTTTADPTIKAHFGAGGAEKRNMALDLTWQNTTLLAKGCSDCSMPTPRDQFKFTYYALEDTDAGIKDFQYSFSDGSVDEPMAAWTDNTCVNDLCNLYEFWSLNNTYENTLEYDGVLGLANSDDTFAA